MNTVVELSPALCLLIFIVFGCLLRGFNPVAVFIHELGHALPALCLTKDTVTLRVGSALGAMQLPITQRFVLSVHLSQGHMGFCHYNKSSLTTPCRIAVALGGPLASACAVLLSAFFLIEPTMVPLTGKFFVVVFFYANLKLFVTSALPLVYRDSASGKPFISDCFDVITMIRG